MKTMAILCGLAMVCLGCGSSSESVVQCGSDEETDKVDVSGSPLGNPDGGADGTGGEGGGASLRPDGASCDNNTECEHAYCVPSKNSFGAGVCFSNAMEGCVLVTDPAPLKQQCASPLKALYTCGLSWDTTTLGTCAMIGTGSMGEEYHCCDKVGPI